MKNRLLLALALAAALACGPVKAQQTQCVSNALAGGTVDHITIPLQPCALSTNILILTAAGANTISQPTLQMAGYPQQNIYTSTGDAPGVGAIPGAGATILLTSTGSSWKIVSGNASTTFSGVLTVPNGGTGLSTITTNSPLIGEGTGNVSTITPGTTGSFLGGNTGSPPSFKSLASNAVTTWSAGTTGFTPSSATSGAITLSGTLGTANGGTGLTGFTTGDLLYASSSSALSKLGIGTSGQFLGVSGGLPAWSGLSSAAVTSISFSSTGLTPSSPTAGAVVVGGTLGVPNGGTGLTTASAHGLLVGEGTSAFGVVSPGTTGQILVAQTGGDPLFTSVPASGVSTISFGTTGLTPSSATGGVVTVGGDLGVPNGGTGQTTLTADGVLYGNTTAGIGATAAGTTGQVLRGATSAAPAFGQVVLTTDVTGVLPVANGGTGQSSYTDGQLLIGNTATSGLTKATLTAGSGVSITNGNGSISIAATGVAYLSFVDNQNTSFNAATGTSYAVNTSGGAITATLPASPTVGMIIAFSDMSGSFATHNLTIAHNGNNLIGLAQDMVVGTNYTSLVLRWSASASSWIFSN